IIFKEDFEQGDIRNRGWTGELYRHDRWDVSTRSPHSGQYAARYDCYVSGTQGSMYTPTINLSQYKDVYLNFWVLQRKRDWLWADYFNHLYVELSNDGGNTWTRVSHLTIIESYRYISLKLDDLITLTDRVKIRFIGQGGNADDNAYDTFLDDIEVTGTFVGPVVKKLNRLDIMKYWAPQIFQDVRSDKPLGHQYYQAQDFILKYDYDKDWNGNNNATNSATNSYSPNFVGATYGTYAETETHIFIEYDFYHSMDDAIIEADRHLHDWEAVRLCIQKDGTTYGKIRAIHSIYHSEGRYYSAGQVSYHKGSHPRMYISSNGDVLNSCWDTGAHGHGIESYKPGEHCTGDDAIVYNVADVGEAPTNTGGGAFRNQYNYSIIDHEELINQGVRGGGNDFATEFANNFPFLKTEAPYSYDYVYHPYRSSGSSARTASLENFTTQQIGQKSASKDGYAYSFKDVYTVVGSGMDIWNTEDHFQYAYQSLNGDGEIVARVYDFQENINGWAKAGIMIRETLESNSKYAIACMSSSYGVHMQGRSTTGANSVHYQTANVFNQAYLRLKRQGDLFTSYYSTDGKNWYFLAEQTITMNPQVYVGLAVSSHNPDSQSAAVFDNVQVASNVQGLANQSRVVDNTITQSKDSSLASSLKAYSNAGQLFLKASDLDLEGKVLHVYNIRGQRVLEKTLKDQPLQQFHFAEKRGIYFVRIQLEGEIFTQKFLVK
ncbi:T9SS type A sorting domain-containing protein, partial [Xanthovirga aplysinae]|uniref:T9SS type A sorting domain-containing protein n=1 Tax=Xanthovirga aplysinae TaxID=2529853 RepID=UPI0012BBDC37